MRYHYEKPKRYTRYYGTSYRCDHPIYNQCTLYLINDRGLAVIQERFDANTKIRWWGEIDPWLCDQLYLHSDFKQYFDEHAGEPINGLYPTVTIRSIMWHLKMKPLPKEYWERIR